MMVMYIDMHIQYVYIICIYFAYIHNSADMHSDLIIKICRTSTGILLHRTHDVDSQEDKDGFTSRFL